MPKQPIAPTVKFLIDRQRAQNQEFYAFAELIDHIHRLEDRLEHLEDITGVTRMTIRKPKEE